MKRKIGKENSAQIQKGVTPLYIGNRLPIKYSYYLDTLLIHYLLIT